MGSHREHGGGRLRISSMMYCLLGVGLLLLYLVVDVPRHHQAVGVGGVGGDDDDDGDGVSSASSAEARQANMEATLEGLTDAVSNIEARTLRIMKHLEQQRGGAGAGAGAGVGSGDASLDGAEVGREYIHPPDPRALANYKRAPKPYRFYGTQKKEDSIVFNEFFKDPLVVNGTFVEIGGKDGSYGNTLFFERYLGWRGVLIEGSPGSFKKLLRNRPLATNIGIAVCAKDGTAQYLTKGGGGTAVDGMVDTMSEKFKNSWHRNKKKNVMMTVPCGPMGRYLRMAGVKRIDFLSVDVEGAELVVLESMDWSIPVHVLCVELDGMSPEKDAKVEELVLSKGFTKLKRVKGNVFFHNEANRNPRPVYDREEEDDE